MPGCPGITLLRPLGAAELSDGTVRHLLWTAALLSPRPPELLVLNEPETSLHPDLLPAVSGLIVRAATTQLVVVTHSRPLLRLLDAAAGELATPLRGCCARSSVRRVLDGQGRLDRPSWHWPKR